MAREFSYQFYHSKLWKDTRLCILMRDKFLCVKCGRPAQEVHHIIHLSPQNINNPMVSINPDNLLSLCKECHFKEHYKDKAEGHRTKGTVEIIKENEYIFDENGYVIPPG